MFERIKPISIEVGRSDEPSRMVINPNGARIENLQLEGHNILISVTRGDRKKASSHPCIPLLGSAMTKSFGLPQDGPMKDEQCAAETVGGHVDLYHEINCGTYPEGLTVVQRFSIFPNTFSLVANLLNDGEVDIPVNYAEQLYLSTPRGWNGLKINGKDVTDKIERSEVISLDRTNEILISGQPRIFLGQEGLPYAKLWVYKNNRSGLPDNKYVCIVPVEMNPEDNPFGKKESLITSLSARTRRFSIYV